jgi:hypothetical protein
VDPARVYERNAQVQGDGVIRKNGCIVNTGDNMTPDERRQRREQNQQLYGLSQQEIDAIEIPTLDSGSSPGTFVCSGRGGGVDVRSRWLTLERPRSQLATRG